MTTVGSFEELKDALSAGGNIQLTGDITTTEALITSGVTATIDLNGNTLKVGAASNKFNNATNLTIQNGTINLDGVVCNANGIIILDERGTQVTTLTLNNVDVEGKDYNSAFAVFYIGRTSILNIIGGSVTLENELFSAGGVFKADSSEGKLTVDGTTMVLTNVKRAITSLDTEIKNADIIINSTANGGLKHGINNCEKLVITDSNITISGGTGCGLNLNGTTTFNGTSVVTVKDMGEAALAFREDCAMTPILTLEDTAVLLLDEKIVNTVKGEVAVADTADLCEAHAITEVKANDSTCTETGNIAHFICEACERVYSDAEG